MKINFYIVFLSIIALNINIVKAQVDTTNPHYEKFLYDNGQISSEGILREGKPDGYWKTYYKDGTIKSEGNRKNFKLDSTWKFYNSDGEINMIINYREGLKNGKRITYSEEEIIMEHFKDGIKDGWTKVFYPDSTVKREVYFDNGKKDGYEKEYDEQGNIIALNEYDQGFLVNREFINRRDNQGRKQGPWKTFYPDGSLKTSGVYLEGEKHGVFREYDKKGNLLNIEKYDKGKKETRDKSVAEYEIKRNYYSSGQVKTEAAFLDGEMDGVRREYDKEGNITESYIMDRGNMVAKGIVDKSGMKQGAWEKYYRSGRLKAKGRYKDDIKVGEWIYYFENGQVEQKGRYNEEGKAEGEWKWYYSNGQLRKQEELNNGVADGMYKEYTLEGELWAKGKYDNGVPEGEWYLSHRGIKENGKYKNGVRQGVWEHYEDGVLVYKGRFEDGLPDGRHVSYYPNGNLKKEGEYNMGEKHGEWRSYTKDGQLFLVVTYRFGKEVKYDRKEIEGAEEKPKE
ncbi:MAG: hypothetical protein R6U19_10225 [Bacteroidales bacterium]